MAFRKNLHHLFLRRAKDDADPVNLKCSQSPNFSGKVRIRHPQVCRHDKKPQSEAVAPAVIYRTAVVLNGVFARFTVITAAITYNGYLGI